MQSTTHEGFDLGPCTVPQIRKCGQVWDKGHGLGSHEVLDSSFALPYAGHRQAGWSAMVSITMKMRPRIYLPRSGDMKHGTVWEGLVHAGPSGRSVAMDSEGLPVRKNICIDF
jgi:hypothetical protein